MTEPAFDYVVIGGGSAGCIVAARLAEARAGSVLLIEAGDPATRHPETLSADGFKHAFANDALMWHRMSAPQAHCAGRALYAGSGRGLGGSGSVNGMVYTRGARGDFEAWPAGWKWDDLAPAFAAVEQRIGIRPRPATPFAEAFLAAAQAAGFRRKDRMNDGDLAGVVGCNDMNYAGQERRSSYRAFVHGQDLPGLTIETGARARRLVLDERGVATAIECEIGGVARRFGVKREAILCAGALETPKLLMRSGVGPRAHLEAHAIGVVRDAPGVGANLQDHPNVCVFYRASADVDFAYPQVYGFDEKRCYVCYAAPASIQQSMQRMLPILALPGRLHDVKPLRALIRSLVNLAFALPPLRRFVSRVFGIVVILGKPASRGSVRLDATDPAYYATAGDREAMLAGVAKARAIAAHLPGARPLSDGAKTDDAERVWKWVTAATMTTFHFCGSCRMGDDAASPVDAQLRVRGLRNVRVADASVVPEIPVSALNAPSMMVGWRAADFILAQLPVARAA